MRTQNILKNAAEISGRTLTDFVVSSAYEAAVRIINEYQQLHLTVTDMGFYTISSIGIFPGELPWINLFKEKNGFPSFMRCG